MRSWLERRWNEEDINVLDKERKLQVLDIVVTIGLFTIGCIVGKLVMMQYDTWLSFNGPAIGVFAIGEIGLVAS